VHPLDRPLDWGLDVGATVESVAHQLEQRLQAVHPGAQVALDQSLRTAEGEQLAAAARLVGHPKRGDHHRLGEDQGCHRYRKRRAESDPCSLQHQDAHQRDEMQGNEEENRGREQRMEFFFDLRG